MRKFDLTIGVIAQRKKIDFIHSQSVTSAIVEGLKFRQVRFIYVAPSLSRSFISFSS